MKYYSFAFSNIIALAPEEGDEPFSGDNELERETVVTVNEQILEQTSLTNHLLTGIIFFIGIVAGIVCMHHFFSKFRK